MAPAGPRGDDPGSPSDVDATRPARTRAAVRGSDEVRYRLLDELGSGAMGVVYTAWDRSLDRKVALKLLHDRFLGRESQARLRAEAQTMARLSHPNVVPVFDVGERDGRTFFAMELVAGDDLGAWLARERTWREIVEVFIDAGHGLAAAHAAGIVHRDFKPSNVLVGDDGRVRVADFGVARAIGTVLDDHVAELSAHAVVETVSGAVVGTPAYMAPEQLRGEEVDDRADQFAFCVSLFEAITGHRPFAGDTLAERLVAIERGAPTLDAEVPPWLAAAVRRGLAADPGQRHADMHALVRSLRGPAPSQRRRAVVALAASALAAGTIAYFAFGGARATAPCNDVERELAGVWDDDRRADVTAALGEAGVSEAGIALVTAPLDRYAAAWMDMRGEACRKTHESGDQTAYVLDLRLRCLSLRRVELGAVADQIVALDGDDVLFGALSLATDLTALDACADVDALAAVTPLPADEDARAEIARVREAVVRAARALDTASPLPLAEGLVADAMATDYAPAIAEARLLYAVRLRQSGDVSGGEAEVRAAARAAAEGNDDRALADAWVELGQNLMRSGRFEEVAGILAAAEPVVVRTRDARLAAGFHNLAATVDEMRGDVPGALEHMRRAVALVRSSGEQARVDLAKYEFRVAYLSEDLGDLETAAEMAQSGIERYRLVYGEDTALAVPGQTTLIRVLAARGAFDEAERVARAAIAAGEQALGWKRPRADLLIDVLNANGAFERIRSDAPAALASHQRALDVATEHEDDIGRVDSFVGLGLARGLSGDREGQLRDCQRALDLAESIGMHKGEPDRLADVLACVAEAYEALGDRDAALSFAERARDTADAAGVLVVRARAEALIERLAAASH